MSYQFELPRVFGADIGPVIRAKADAQGARMVMSDDEHRAWADHIDGIVHAAETLVSYMSRSEGSEPDVRVVVTGHANPGHLPREGYSDEHITISIGVLPQGPSDEEIDELLLPIDGEFDADTPVAVVE